MIDRIKFQKKIGKRIEELRTEKGISQSELARRCFRDQQTISRLEKGMHAPVTYILYEVAKALEVKLMDILSVVDE